MRRGSLIFSIILLLVVILLFGATMAYPPRSKLFPSIALSTALILLIIQIVREALPRREKNLRKRTEKPRGRPPDRLQSGCG
ncbi:MAG: hypothetical protein WCO26_02035 [Deltaproteobacteria bacterium]